MAFKPIVSSGVPYTLNIQDDVEGYTAELTAGSVLQSVGVSPHDWLGTAFFSIADGVTVRVTSQFYNTGFAGNDRLWYSGPNISPSEWSPENITDDSADAGVIAETITSDGTGFGLVIQGDRSGAEFKFLIEVDVPEPPVALGDPYVIRGTHRAYIGTDNPQTAWIRTETGKLDLAGVTELKVAIKKGRQLVFEVDGTSPELGRVDFTLTEQQIKARLLRAGSYTLFIRADGRTVYIALLEVIG